MPVTNINIALPDNLTNLALVEKLGSATVDKAQFANNLINLVQGLASGSTIGAISYETSPGEAVTKLSLDIVFDNAGFADDPTQDVILLGVLNVVCVSGAPSGDDEFQIGATSADTAAAYADMVNDFGVIAGNKVSATVDGATVTVTQNSLGISIVGVYSLNDAFAAPSSNTFGGNPTFDTTASVGIVLNYGLNTDAP